MLGDRDREKKILKAVKALESLKMDSEDVAVLLAFTMLSDAFTSPKKLKILRLADDRAEDVISAVYENFENDEEIADLKCDE